MCRPLLPPLGATLLFFLHDTAGLEVRSEQGRRLCLQGGYSVWRAYVEVFLGWLAVMRSQVTAGIAQSRRGLSEWQAAGMAVGVDSIAVALANGCLAAVQQDLAGQDATGRCGGYWSTPEQVKRIG